MRLNVVSPLHGRRGPATAVSIPAGSQSKITTMCPCLRLRCRRPMTIACNNGRKLKQPLSHLRVWYPAGIFPLPDDPRSSTSSEPVIPLSRLVTVADRSFAVAGPRLWNTLPEDITSAPSLLVFRRKLKTHLFRQSYPDIIL